MQILVICVIVFFAAGQSADINIIWAGAAMIFAAFVLCWAAEAAQFLISQGLALAILAVLQALPEIAVEWDIAHGAALGKNPIHEMTSNFTGAVRLIAGFGVPVVFFIHSKFWRLQLKRMKQPIRLEPKHTVEVVSLLPPLIYFVFICFKGTLEIYDSVVLFGYYIFYVIILIRLPPEHPEKLEELGYIPKSLVKQKGAKRISFIAMFFAIGGLIIYIAVHPFVDSLRSLAVSLGISSYFMIQWVAPFLSEMPEKLSAFNWATHEKKASMALMNFASANIFQWTSLPALIPVVFCVTAGAIKGVYLDEEQLSEIRLTIAQSLLIFTMFLNMSFEWPEAIGIFTLWLAQFLLPSLREEIIFLYMIWCGVEVILLLAGTRRWKFPLSIFATKKPPHKHEKI